MNLKNNTYPWEMANCMAASSSGFHSGTREDIWPRIQVMSLLTVSLDWQLTPNFSLIVLARAGSATANVSSDSFPVIFFSVFFNFFDIFPSMRAVVAVKASVESLNFSKCARDTTFEAFAGVSNSLNNLSTFFSFFSSANCCTKNSYKKMLVLVRTHCLKLH